MAANLLGLAAQQQAIFQLTISAQQANEPFRYMVCRGVQGDSVVLACWDPNHNFRKALEQQEFPFRFLLQTQADKFPRLHKFQGRITAIHQDCKTITVAIPESITVLEQRRNIRLKLQRRHLPSLSIWGVARGKSESQSKLVEQRLLIELTDQADEMQALLKNISAGGMRLALPRHVYAQHEPWLAQNGRLLVRLTFPGEESDQEHAYEFIAKVSNTLVKDDVTTCPEIGVQFLSALGKGLQSRWRDVRADGCLDLLKLLQAYQLEYYRDLKKNLLLREDAACRSSVAAESWPRSNVR
ncbi:PilZ domain-containing protein [Desulfovibrio sp. TomC]|uniref:PilZ domain-containing protein n=1 Tax=Desulfovibrio sp. TomC TaxID=1562888 RepID=UPI0018CF9EE0|nr:PilZ domain-containing protein [Desulfovibrio sp. TomC]